MSLRINRRQLGIVVDEYGSVIGILTPADIISRLVGQYPNEFAAKSELVRKLVGSQWEIHGSTRLNDLEQMLNFPFPRKTGTVTIAGLVFNRVGRVPEVGDVIRLENGRLQILEIQDLRIMKVLFQVMRIDDQGQWTLADADSPADNGHRKAAA